MRISALFISVLTVVNAGCVEDSVGPDPIVVLACEAQRAQFEPSRGFGLTTGDDGRLFLDDGNGITRLSPDGAIEEAWQPDAGVAFDDLAWTPSRLYASSRSTGVVAFDPAGPADQEPRFVISADVAGFGITGDRDGGLYYARASDPTIARLWPSGVVTSEVTASPLPGPIGDLALADDGAMWVVTMFGGDIYRLELDDAHREVSRTLVTRTGLPFVVGLDVDADDRVYYGGAGALYRLAPPYADADLEVLADDVSSLAKIAVGRGATCPADIYVTAAPGAAVAGD